MGIAIWKYISLQYNLVTQAKLKYLILNKTFLTKEFLKPLLH